MQAKTTCLSCLSLICGNSIFELHWLSALRGPENGVEVRASMAVLISRGERSRAILPVETIYAEVGNRHVHTW